MPYETIEKFDVVVLYDPAYVQKAMVTYSHLVRELEGTYTLELHLWRLDIAVAEDYAAEAARDIATAALIIIAVRGSQPCPAAFQRWMCADGGPHFAIIALTEESDRSALSPGSWNSVLRASATPIHPEIFVWEPAAVAGKRPELGVDTQCAELADAGQR